VGNDEQHPQNTFDKRDYFEICENSCVHENNGKITLPT